MARNSRPRSAVLWLELLLVGALASVVLILAQTIRATGSSRVVAQRALRDYAGFAAWSYREHLVTTLREAIDEVLGPVNHGDGLHVSPTIPHARELGHYLPWDVKCQCHKPRHGPLPERYLGFTLGTDTLGVGNNLAPPGSQGWLVDPPKDQAQTIVATGYAPAEMSWINALLTDVARRPSRSNWGYDLIVARRDGSPRVFATRSMPTAWGDTIVYAVEYPAAAIDEILRGVLASSDLLPPSLVAGRPNASVLDLEVADSGGAPLFRTEAAIPWDLDAHSTLPESFGALRVRAQLRPQLAGLLLIGGTPKSGLPLLLSLLALSVGLTVFAAVLLRREVQFASERAEFVANVSHELRTPLTQVRLVLDTLRLGRDGGADARARALAIADRELLRLQHLVEAVLRFTRGPRRDDQPRIATDVAAEVRAVVTEFQPLAESREVTFEVLAGGPVPATLQQGAFRQLLLNLLDNAVKYGGDRSVVTVEVSTMEGGGARVAVSDSGPGVPPGDRERIWHPFERGEAARAHATGGSGIGLTIVRQIAEDHGGRASVEQAAGGGARFVIDLPGGSL